MKVTRNTAICIIIVILIAGTLAWLFSSISKIKNDIAQITGTDRLTTQSANSTSSGTSLEAGRANVTRSASMVVAASDAPRWNKAQADYICDGVNDQQEIQTAIDFLNANKGGRLLLSEGIFYISAPINLEGGITIQGQAMAIDDSPNQVGTRLYLADGADCSICVCNSAEYFCNITDVTFNGNFYNQTAEALDDPLIDMRSCADFILERVFIRNSYGDAIKIKGSDYARLTNVWVQGVGLESSGAALRYTGSNAISAITNCNFSGQNGIIIEGGGFIQINNSTFYPIGQYAIEFLSNTATVQVINSFFTTSGITIYSPDIGGNIMMTNCIVRCPASVVELGGTNGSILLSNNDFSKANKPFWYAKNLAPIKSDVFMDVQAISKNYLVAAQSLNVTTPIYCKVSSSPDVPRNLTISISDNDKSISAFNINVTGVSAATGETFTETFSESGGLTQNGTRAFATVTSVVVSSITGANAGDTLDAGIGSRLGLSGVIFFTQDVVKVKRNNTDYPAVNYTIDKDNNTFDVSGGSAIMNGDNFTIWYKSSYNRWNNSQ